MKNLNIGPAEKERLASGLQNEHRERMPESPLPKGKRTELMSRAPNCEVGESQGERESHLGEREREIRAGRMERKESALQ